MKTVQFPRGATAAEDGIVGVPGQVRVDTSRNELRVHDGTTPGGHRLPNLDTISQLLATGSESALGSVQVFANEAALAAAPVSPDVIGIVSQNGFDDAFVWRLTGDAKCVQSTVQGFWHRLDGAPGLIVRFWRAGLINLQVNGVAPVVTPELTVWIDAGVVKMYDGTSYLAATPTLFGRLLAQVGGYFSGSVGLPNRILDQETDIADCNTAAASGWYRTTAGAANSPIAGVQSFEHREINATTAVQIMQTQGSSTAGSFIRYRSAGPTWSSWIAYTGSLPSRLGALSAVVTDADTAQDSGFYQAASTATHIPISQNGVLIVNRYDANNGNQMWMSLVTNQLWVRTRTASVYSAWGQVYPVTAIDVATHAYTAKGTMVDADEVAGNNSAASFAGAKWLASTIWTYIQGKAAGVFQPFAAALTSFVTLVGTIVAGDLIYGSGAGVLARLVKATDGMILTLVAGLPAWAAAPSSGMTLIATLNTTSGTTQTATGLATTYNRFYIQVEAVNMSTSTLKMSVSSDNGSTFDTATIINNDTGGLAKNSVVLLAGVGETIAKVWSSISAYPGGGLSSSSFATKTSPTNAIQFSGGTFTGGVIKIWGEK